MSDGIIAKTTYTFEVLHPADRRFEHIEAAIREADEGYAVGNVTEETTRVIHSRDVAFQLKRLGNDGTFFDDDIHGEPSEVRVHFQPEAWQNDYAIEVDDQGPDVWNVSVETAAQIQAALDRDGGIDLDFVRGDEHAPRWVAHWSGPFTITVVK